MMGKLLQFIIALTKITEPSKNNAVHGAFSLNHGRSTCVFSDNFTPWLDENFKSIPLILWDNPLKWQPGIVDSYILDIRDNQSWSVDQVKAFRRVSSTKFFIVASANQTNGDKLRKSVQNFGLCNATIVTEIGEGVLSVQHGDEKCVGRAQQLIADKCLVNSSFMHFEPLMLLQNGRMAGWEGSILQTVADHLKIQVTWLDKNETGFPEILDDAAEGRSLFSTGGAYGLTSRYARTDFIPSCYPLTLKFVVPLHAGKSTPTWFIILASELSPTVWFCVAMTYLFYYVMAGIFKNPESSGELGYRPFYVFAMVLGRSENDIYQRGFIGNMMFFGFMISIYYQSIMSSKLTAPEKPAEIDTWAQMLETGWPIKGLVPMKRMVEFEAAANPNNSVKQEMSRRLDPTLGALEEGLLRIVEKRDYIVVRQTSSILYVSKHNPKLDGNFHIVEEPLNTFFPMTMLSKYSCMTEKMTLTFCRICGSGLAAKWYHDYNTERPAFGPSGPETLKIHHIQGFIYLLVSGLFISVAVFSGEILIRRDRLGSFAKYFEAFQPRRPSQLFLVDLDDS